ncbi:MAG: tetratricopeptide repeat protein [Phototrophicaceae bacterium]
MLIEIGLALACVIFVAVITRENGKRKNTPSPNATHPLADDKHSNDSYLKAREHYNNKHYKDALRDIDNALDLQPECKNCLWLRAKIFIVLEQYQEAIVDCNEMLDLDDGYYWAYAVRGNAYLLLKQYEKALDDLEQALLIQPDMQEAHISRMRVYYAMGQIDVGDDILQKQLKNTDDDYIFYIIAGHSNYNTKRFEKAIEYTEKAISYSLFSSMPDETKFDIYHNLWWSYYALRDYESATKIYNKINKLNFTPSKGHRLRALMLKHQSKFEEAKDVYKQALEEGTEDKHILLDYSMLLRELKDFDKALENDTKIIEMDEQKGLSSRIHTFTYLEQYDKAIHDLDRLIEIAPDNAQTYNNRAWYKSYTGDYKGALLDIEKAILLDNTQGTFFSTRGQVNWLTQNYNEALADFTKAIELSPNMDIHMFEIAIALAKLNQTPDAIELWQEATSKNAECQSAEAYQDKYRFAPPFYEAMQALEKLAQDSD